MARTPNKKQSAKAEVKEPNVNPVVPQNKPVDSVKNIQDKKPAPKTKEAVPENIVRLMKLNPQYAQFYVTPEGFVHPVGVPEYLRKNAKLYTNKYFKK